MEIESDNKAKAQNTWSRAISFVGRTSNSKVLVQFLENNIRPAALTEKELTLEVNNEFVGAFTDNNYGDILREALSEAAGGKLGYVWKVTDEPIVVTEAPSSVTAAPAKPANVESLEDELEKSAEKIAETADNEDETDEFTFKNFIVGDANRHSFTAAKAVSEEPGRHYNPLFLYGSNGVGKTHLLQAIAHELRIKNPKRNIMTINCSEMLDNFYTMLREQKAAGFAKSFNKVDVLLIDDIHGLANKPLIQEDFFNVFNALQRKKKQIIFTSDRQPCEMKGIDKRLTTRFESGLMSEVGMPEYEARLAILRMWRDKQIDGYRIGDEFLDFLAEHISSSVRRLHSAYNILSNYTFLSGGYELNIPLAEHLLKKILEEERQASAISIDTIQKVVSSYFKLTPDDLLGTKRSRNIAVPRMIAMALAYSEVDSSTTDVGNAFRRTHAAVLHAQKQVNEFMANDAKFKQDYENIRRLLGR